MKIEIRPGRTLEINYLKHPTSQKTVFLFHGLGGWADQWRKQIPILVNEYNVVVPHLLGHLGSPIIKDNTNNPYTYPEMLADMLAIFDKYKTTENNVIGHSYGGALAVGVALQHQQELSHLILINPLPENNQPIPFIYHLPPFILEIIKPLLMSLFDRLAFDKSAPKALLQEEHTNAIKNNMYVIKKMVSGMQALPHFDISQLKIPTLIILGESDKLILPERSKTFFATLPSHQFKIIPNAAHLVLLEKSELVNQAILDWLN